jgi:hypothetical protein
MHSFGGALGFSCSLKALHGDLRVKLLHLLKKKKKFDLDLDPDPGSEFTKKRGSRPLLKDGDHC